ncbi:MAG TPA: MMPL family transporter [Actinocrinis sp.]|nr:MMPL family transporter [Actinocrinis sp.]
MTVAWLLLLIAGIATVGATAKRMTNSFAMPGPSFAADSRITALYHAGTDDPLVPVITLPAGETVRSPGVAARVDAAFAAGTHVLPGSRLVDYATTGDPAFATKDGRSTFGLITTAFTGSTGGAVERQLQQAVAAKVPQGWTVGVTGKQALTDSQPAAKGVGVLMESLLGAAGALLILAFVFASFLALVPLLMAAVSVMTSFLAVGALTHLTPVSMIVEFLIALIGLGVAIDYSLLIVTRWREERAHGADNTQAVQTAMEHAGRSVVFSGVTVGVGLLALVLLPVPFLRSTGIGGFLIPLVSVAVAATLLPVLLATVGPWLDHPRWRNEGNPARLWTRWAAFTVRHRAAAAIAGCAALAVLIVPSFSQHLGNASSASLANAGPAYTTLRTLESGGVPSGVLTPIQILTTSDAAAAAAQRLAGLPGVHAAVAPIAGGQRAAGTALVTVLPTAETSGAAGQATVGALRAATAQDTHVLGIGGSGAETIDFNHDVYGSFPLMLAVIALATFLLLARAFRSLLLPAKAVLMNLASLGAAYGAMVFIWQQGHLSHAVWGLPATGAITMWVPVMVFAFLFGLSMDYEVLILARMRESYDATGSTRQAVITGIGRTGRLVTCAALILMFSFLSMSTGPGTDIKVLATGLGVGILVDATLIRCLLVPAFVGLLGGYNWWLPAWAARLLRTTPSALRPAEPVLVERPSVAAQIGDGADLERCGAAHVQTG